MDTVRVFRRLVMAQLFLFLVFLVLAVVFPVSLPQEVQSWLDTDGAGPLVPLLYDSEGSSSNIAGWAVLIALMVLYITVLVGLLALKRWARILYLLCTVGSLALMLVLGYTVVSPVDNLLFSLDYLMDGAVIVMLLFVPAVRDRFAPAPP
jgi:hypothetical protein